MTPTKDIRAAVVIAHYGTKNVLFLDQVLSAWETMPAVKAEVTVLTGKDLAAGENPGSLPFLARRRLVEKFLTGEYDLFVYSEDDMLITEQNLYAYSKLTGLLRPGEVAGFLRYETDPATGEMKFPDMHATFHWQNWERRKGMTLAEFTNQHQGCYLLTPIHLRLALESKGFVVAPHSDLVYGMLERGASDPFLQCGLRRVIALNYFEQLLIHHLPNNYLHLGKPASVVSAELKQMGIEWP